MSSSRLYRHKRELGLNPNAWKETQCLAMLSFSVGLVTGICGNNLSVCRKTIQLHKQKERGLDWKQKAKLKGNEDHNVSMNFVPCACGLGHQSKVTSDNFKMQGKWFGTVTPCHFLLPVFTSRALLAQSYHCLLPLSFAVLLGALVVVFQTLQPFASP